MKTVKYLFFCLMDCLSLNVAFTKDFIVGCIQIVVFFAVFLVSTVLLTWYYGILITLGTMFVLYGTGFIGDIFVALIKNKNGRK